MDASSQFETLTKRSLRVQTKIETFVSDLRQLVRAIEAHIKFEEDHANVSDPMKAIYPDVARRLAVRRENLIATIASLEGNSAIGPGRKH
jgi:hypothetical protein